MLGGAAPGLPAEERQRRDEAVRFADASIGLEGMVVSAAERVRANHFIAGEIDLAEFLAGPLSTSAI